MGRAYDAVMRWIAGIMLVAWVAFASACASSGESNADADAGGAQGEDAGHDTKPHDSATADDSATSDSAHDDSAAQDASSFDAGTTDTSVTDASTHDTSVDTGSIDTGSVDTGSIDTGTPDTSVGVITGGPCISGAAGATAYRVRFVDAGGTAQVAYEVDGLPDRSRNRTGTYGYQIGFTSSFVDPYLGDGGVQLDSSDFIDIELSTVGLASIQTATLSVFGRSFNTTTNGSFNWQTFVGTGATPTDFVSNIAPYRWYSADFTTEISPGDNGVLIRIKAGPSSGALVVNRIEICMQAM